MRSSRDVLPKYCSSLEEAAGAFGGGRNCRFTALGEGNINDTFLVAGGDVRFVLQRINAAVFADPVKVAMNSARVAAHIAAKAEGKAMLVAEVFTSEKDRCWYRDESGEVWRAQRYIANSRVVQRVKDSNQAREIGGCLAAFHEAVDDLKPSSLHVVLPGFHDLPAYLQAYDRVAGTAPVAASSAAESLEFCRESIARWRQQACFFVAAQRRRDVVQHTVHGDPKVSNILFDADSGAAAAMIDLDTVGAGLVLQDIGDCLRSCCSSVREDDLGRRVACDPAMVAAVMEGYLDRRPLSPFERRSLHSALLLITFELGVRFLTDYLQGNRYFKVTKADDNLRKAVVQFRLATSIEEQKQAIEESVATR